MIHARCIRRWNNVIFRQGIAFKPYATRKQVLWTSSFGPDPTPYTDTVFAPLQEAARDVDSNFVTGAQARVLQPPETRPVQGILRYLLRL